MVEINYNNDKLGIEADEILNNVLTLLKLSMLLLWEELFE
jgi:hypothetical protein